ncbi:hypothetical protein DJ68_07830 [Halorubrum sp. C3]|nr:hypothetical protein DJ68_07830 [Halorubrum sp. C3]
MSFVTVVALLLDRGPSADFEFKFDRLIFVAIVLVGSNHSHIPAEFSFDELFESVACVGGFVSHESV